MKSLSYARAIQAALIGIAMTSSATLARADIKDDEFRDWQLSLGAKVQGEAGTVENKLVLKATP